MTSPTTQQGWQAMALLEDEDWLTEAIYDNEKLMENARTLAKLILAPNDLERNRILSALKVDMFNIAYLECDPAD